MGLTANAYTKTQKGVSDRKHFLTTGIKTVALADCGIVQRVTATAHIITLPATAAGLVFVVENGAADGACAVRIAPNAADKISGAGLTPADNKYIQNTLATAKRGDYVKLVAEAATGWTVTEMAGVWVRE